MNMLVQTEKYIISHIKNINKKKKIFTFSFLKEIIIQQRNTKSNCQKVEKIVVSSQNDANLEQHLKYKSN